LKSQFKQQSMASGNHNNGNFSNQNDSSITPEEEYFQKKQ